MNVGLSVSRVGGTAQIKAMKKVAGKIKLELAQFRELEAFAQFGSDLDEGTKRQLERGKRAVEVLKQPQYSPVNTVDQIVILYALINGFIDEVKIDRVKEFEVGLAEYANKNAKTFYKEVNETRMWTDAGEAELKKVITDFVASFNQ